MGINRYWLFGGTNLDQKGGMNDYATSGNILEDLVIDAYNVFSPENDCWWQILDITIGAVIKASHECDKKGGFGSEPNSMQGFNVH